MKKKQDKFTYSDWLKGKVVLEFSRRSYNPDELSPPTIVNWQNFEEEEKVKIQAKQKCIFGKTKLEHYTKVSNQYIENLQRTKAKSILIDRLLKRFNQLFSGNLKCEGGICFSDDKYFNYPFLYYQELIHYINIHFIGGEEYDFSNVISPNCVCHNKEEIMPEIMAETAASMILWLKSEKNKLANRNQNEFFLDIFKDLNAHNFFLKLKVLITSMGKTEIEKYAFIFHYMKRDGFIKEIVTQPIFIDFLREYHNVNIEGNKLPYRPQKKNIDLYKGIVDTYRVN